MEYIILEGAGDFAKLSGLASPDSLFICLSETVLGDIPADLKARVLQGADSLPALRDSEPSGEYGLLLQMMAGSVSTMPIVGKLIRLAGVPGNRMLGRSRHPLLDVVRSALRNAGLAATEPREGGALNARLDIAQFPFWFGVWPAIARISELPQAPLNERVPSLGVIMPAHNAQSTIAHSIRSVLMGLGPEDRLYVIENGSSDETWPILDTLYRDEPKIKLLRLPNGDAALARSAGVAECACDYVAFCDADDIWSSAKPAIVRAILAQTDADMFAHPVLTISDGLPSLFEPVSIVKQWAKTPSLLGDLLFRGNLFSTSAFVVRRSLFRKPAFAPGLRHTQDYEAWCRLALDHPHPRFAYLDMALAYYQFWGGLSHSVDTRIANVSGIARIYSRYLPWPMRVLVLIRNTLRTIWYAARCRHPLAVAWRALIAAPDPAIGAPRE